MSAKRWLCVMASPLVLGLVILGCSSPAASVEDSRAPAVGKRAPDFALQTVDGDMMALSDFRGRAVLLNFWATWCPPCRFEMPALNAAHARYADKGFAVLAVDVGEAASTVKEFAQEQGLVFPILLDSKSEVARLYEVRVLPTSFLIDGEGVIRAVKFGYYKDLADISNSLAAVLD